MNGLAKASGVFSILAGIVFIIAVVLGLKDGLSITDNCLEDFVAVENFNILALVSGLLAIIAGYTAISAGVFKKNAAHSVYGVFLVLLGIVIALTGYKADFNSLSWEHMEILIVAGFVAVAGTFALARAKERRFALADVAIVLAFIVVIVFALKMKILIFVLGMVVVIILGILSIASAKPKAEAEEEEADEEIEEEAVDERVVTPAAAPVAAAPPAEKPAAEESAEAAPAEKPAAKPAPAAAAAAEAKPAEKPAEAPKAEAPKAEEPKAEEPKAAPAAAAAAAAATAAAAEPSEESSAADDYGLSDEDLGLIPDTPSGFVRRACWNKGLRCRKDYGPCVIPFAFVKSKVAVYIDGATADTSNDAKLQADAWVVLHFKEADVTDGQVEAEAIYAAVKENTKALKKAKAKKKR